MKKILILMLLAFSVNVKAENEEPKYIIEYEYSNASDTLRVANLKADVNFCCYYDIVMKANNTDSDVCYIKDKKTGVLLGTLYGKPTKEFLLLVYEKNLKNAYTPEQMAQLVELQKIRIQN
jgi:hypothetical protein